MKRYSPSFTIMEMNRKPQAQHLVPVGMAQFHQHGPLGENREPQPVSVSGGIQHGAATTEDRVVVSYKAKHTHQRTQR